MTEERPRVKKDPKFAEKKIGKGNRLNSLEKRLIEDLTLQSYTDEEIAKKIKRSVSTVQKYRKQAGFSKPRKGQIIVNQAVVVANNKKKDKGTEAERLKEWKDIFKKSTRYVRLVDELIYQDLLYFMDQWASYHLQMEDMKPAEEDTLEILITYQIRIRHNRKDYKSLQIAEERYQKELGDVLNMELDLEDEKSRFIWEAIISNNNAKKELNKEFKDLTDKHDNLLKSLNVTRQQREEQQKIGADTFLSLIKKLNDKEQREEIGKYNERMRFSTETQIKRLKEPYEFLDGNVEPIYLDGNDFKKNNNKEKD